MAQLSVPNQSDYQFKKEMQCFAATDLKKVKKKCKKLAKKQPFLSLNKKYGSQI